MIERVLENLRKSKEIEEIIVAVSDSTPKTAGLMRALGVEIIKTPGTGFCSDMNYAIKKRGISSPVLVISADLPLATGALIDEILAFYKNCGKPALTVAARVDGYERLGMKPEYTFQAKGKHLVPVGINVIDGGRIEDPYMEEEVLVLKRVKPVLNVNTADDVETVERLLAEQQEGLRA